MGGEPSDDGADDGALHVGVVQTDFAASDIGGGEIHTEHLARALSALGHRVTVYTDTPTTRRSGIGDIDVREYATPSGRNPVNELTLAARAWRDLYDPDVLLLTDDSAWLAARHPRPTAMVFHFVWHGWVHRQGSLANVVREKPQALVYRRMERGIATAVDRIVSISPNIREDIDRIGDFDRKVRPIPNGVDVDRFRPGDRADGPFTVHFQGRLVPMKNPDVLIRAVAASGEGWHLTVGGDGPMRTELETLAAELGVDERVRFLGYIPDEDLPDRYARSDLYVLPSSYEGMPLTVLEAAASGLPVVASPRAATDFVTEDFGRVVTPEPEAIAAAIDDLASNPTAVDRMAAAARRRAESYSWDRIAAEYAAMFEELIEAHGPSV